MDADIRIFINGIKEKTGIDFSVYDSDGVFIAGNQEFWGNMPADIDDVYTDQINDKTIFNIRYKSRNFIGCINGSSEVEKNYAYLIGELAENSFFKESALSRPEFCRALLQGEANYSQILRYQKKYNMKDMPAFVLIITLDSRYNDVVNVLKTYSEERSDFVVKIDSNQLAFVKFLDEASNEYQSSTEYAEFLRQSIYEETGVSVRIFVGSTVKTLVDLSTSYSQALSSVRMSGAINAKGEVHSFKEYVLIRMLEDMPKFKLNEYLEILMDSGAKEIFSDDEMINTAEEFLENSLNVSETARKLYLHRNTLTYRLDKIERGTGLNIRKFSDAVTFRLITVLSRLVR